MKVISMTLAITACCILSAAGCAKFRDSSSLSRLAVSDFIDPEVVNVEVKNYCPETGRTYKDLFVRNLSVHVVRGQLSLDSDKDGVPDFIEEKRGDELNISPYKADSNDDKIGDLLIYLSGIDRFQQSRLRCLDPANSDGSATEFQDPGLAPSDPPQFLGLRNCEKEQLTHTDPLLFDSDGDGLPDYLELRCGLNARDPNDALLDTDGDGLSNYQECKRHTPIGESNRPQGLQKVEYKYLQEAKIAGGKKCFDFTVSNIPVLNGGSGNLIALYLIEMDGLNKARLYTAFELLGPGSAGKTFVLEFGPSPEGRFTAK